jgi:hypothetical protein
MEKQFKQYTRKGVSELIEWTNATKEMADKCSISEVDKLLSITNKEEFDKGFIARNPKNHEDLWYVSKKYFDDNLEEVLKVGKTLDNTTASQATKNVKDIVFWGNGDTFKLISKASSVNEGWMKSTKAMSIPGIGCVVQVTTQQGDNVAEALTFVPNARIKEVIQDGVVTSRYLTI